MTLDTSLFIVLLTILITVAYLAARSSRRTNINIKLLDPPPQGWEKVPSDDAWCTKELHRELTKGHELYGRKVIPLIRTADDILFYVKGGPKPLAEVHLTRHAAERPPWPSTGWYESVEEWLHWQQPDTEQK